MDRFENRLRGAFAIFALVGIVAMSARADYLYWQLNKPVSLFDGTAMDDFKYVSAERVPAEISEHSQEEAPEEEEEGEEEARDDDDDENALVAADAETVKVNMQLLGENATIYSYYVEGFNYSTMSETEGISEIRTYGSLLQSKAPCNYDATTPIHYIPTLRIWLGDAALEDLKGN